MSPAMAVTTNEATESEYHKGVKRLSEKGISKLPRRYIVPACDRPNVEKSPSCSPNPSLKLPVIDLAQLQSSDRSKVLNSLAVACEEYGFFQVVNHGMGSDVLREMREVCRRFFELPFEERGKYMTADMSTPVRYGTSFNQAKDSVFCWRDFLKLTCHPMSDALPYWPSSPSNFRRLAGNYAKETRNLFLMLMEAILESLGVLGGAAAEEEDEEEATMMLKELEDGSQMMVINCFPQCPEPHLTLGMPPHSDYGFLTVLLQDEVEGLQIHHKGNWITVDPIPNSFVVNVGDHLEIFSNGKYKSVLHRVTVNAAKPRISVATLHSLPFKCMVRPSLKLVNAANPRRYKDTDFATFLDYISSREPKSKNFLDSRKIIHLE